MKKKLRIRDRLLLGLAISADELIPRLLAAGRGRTPQSAPSWLPPKYKKETFYSLAWRLYKTGFVEKVIKNGVPYLRLANKGKKEINRDFSYLSLQKKKWDWKWRMVIFDFPEPERKKRDLLRDKIISLGFGKLQRSIYISPHDYTQDLAEFLSHNRLLGDAFVLTAKHELMGDPSKLADRVWLLEELNKKYEDLLIKMEDNPPKSLTEIREIKSAYLEIVIDDPFLPKKLLPVNWYGQEVRKLVVRL